MTKRRNAMEKSSEFWCINCGNKGIPIIRMRGKPRKEGHRKGLYCLNCRMVINHIETHSEEEARKFREKFDAGEYIEEAEKSIAYAKEHNL